MRFQIITSLALALLLGMGASRAAFAGSVEIQSIQINPAAPTAGELPEITGTVTAESANAAAGITEINVFAFLTRPDHAVKLWSWKKIRISSGEIRIITIPKEYEMKLRGVYSVDFRVYSKDMSLLTKLSKNFTVVDPAPPLITTTSRETVSGGTVTGSAQEAVTSGAGTYSDRETVTSPPGTSSRKAHPHPADDRQVGLGAVVNTANTAGGATILLWPLKYLALQGSYTMGKFTTTEGRVLARAPFSSAIKPYVGVGYARVTAERTVEPIGVKTTFTDSGVSGVIGVELPLMRGVRCSVEISNAIIDLKKEITGGGLKGTATPHYYPLTFGLSIVYYAF